MKKFLLFQLNLLLLFCSFFLIKQNSTVFSDGPMFARIKSYNCRLYKTAVENNNISNVICYLEPTYFVQVLLNFNSEFYKVEYSGVVGYALKSDIQLVSETPKMPYPSCHITTVNSKCYLRSSPSVESNNSNVVCVLPANCQKLNFIGKMQGFEVVDYKGTLWYFCEYLGEYGYIYNNYVANISSIFSNLEEIEPISNVSEVINPLTNPECAIIIVIILIPAIFILILLYKKPNIKPIKSNERYKINAKHLKERQEEENL